MEQDPLENWQKIVTVLLSASIYTLFISAILFSSFIFFLFFTTTTNQTPISDDKLNGNGHTSSTTGKKAATASSTTTTNTTVSVDPVAKPAVGRRFVITLFGSVIITIAVIVYSVYQQSQNHLSNISKAISNASKPYPSLDINQFIVNDNDNEKIKQNQLSMLNINDIKVVDDDIVDQYGRSILFRGVNLGGDSKFPVTPSGQTYLPFGNDFLSKKYQSSISFIGRPFPVNEADEHFARLKAWGFTTLRFLVTWEAVEHSGPGQYDKEYIQYVLQIIRKAAKYGISVFIDPHQDVWSRWTGGDGAPLWTLEKVGFNVSNLHETGAAFLHQMLNGSQMPKMIWPTGYSRLATATMFTLFFAGNEFAPKTFVDGVPVQDYLQNHYIKAIAEIAKVVKDEPNVIGFDSLNEPSPGFVGCRDLNKLLFPAPLGWAMSPWMGMQLGSGSTLNVNFFSAVFVFERTDVLNAKGFSAWLSPEKDVWLQNGVWQHTVGIDGLPKKVLIDPYYFAKHHNVKKYRDQKIDFVKDFMTPFFAAYTKAIREAGNPKWIIFAEPSIDPVTPVHGSAPETLKDDFQIYNWIWAPHNYDAVVLLTKTFKPWYGLDTVKSLPVVGPLDVVNNGVCNAVHHVSESGKTAKVPVIIGEVGISVDLDEREAYKLSNTTTNENIHYVNQNGALDRSMRCLEDNKLSFTLWNYAASNTHEHGDGWNGEDLSLFSRQGQKNKNDIYSGGRALPAAIRPYPLRLSGSLVSYSFNPFDSKRSFELTIKRSQSFPTEQGQTTIIYVPRYQYPSKDFHKHHNGTGTISYSVDEQLLYWHHGKDDIGFFNLELTL